jgi:hypothetical protein
MNTPKTTHIVSVVRVKHKGTKQSKSVELYSSGESEETILEYEKVGTRIKGYDAAQVSTAPYTPELKELIEADGSAINKTKLISRYLKAKGEAWSMKPEILAYKEGN